MNEKKIFYYKLLIFALLLLFGIEVKLIWFIALLVLGFGASFIYDIMHLIKFKYLPRYNDSEIIEFSNKAARNSFFIIMGVIMSTMVYFDLKGIEVSALTLITPLFALSLFVYGANYLYYKYNLQAKEYERDYYLPRIMSVALTSVAFYFVRYAFKEFNVTWFFITLIPGTLLLLLSLFTWKREKLGGLLFLLLGVGLCVYSLVYNKMPYVIMSIAVITNGLLYLIHKVK